MNEITLQIIWGVLYQRLRFQILSVLRILLSNSEETFFFLGLREDGVNIHRPNFLSVENLHEPIGGRTS